MEYDPVEGEDWIVKKMSKKNLILCIIPGILIIILGVRLVMGIVSYSRGPAAALEGETSAKAITVEQVSSEYAPKPFEEVQTIDLQTIEDGFFSMGFLVTQEGEAALRP